ncbi:MAG: aminotransferase class V-fold PLP-dependent enzyme [Desulfurivibrionaceae bacterium]
MTENRFIYLDNNATTRVAPQVVEDMLPFFSQYYGNPSSGHSCGRQSARALSEAREQTASLFKCSPEEIIYNSCGTESDVTAILAALKSFPDKRHIVTTSVEHPAVKNLCENLTGITGREYRVTTLKVNPEGKIDLREFENSLSKDTVLASIMWANNETGVIFPIEELAGIAGKYDVLFHTDAVQAVGKLDLDMQEVPVDYLSLSGHKFHAPKGVGALYVRRGAPFHPFLPGGGQEGGRRAGTENTAYIAGLGRACDLAADHLREVETSVRYLRDKLEQGLLEAIPGAAVNGGGSRRLPNTSNIRIPGIRGDELVRRLDEKGICASAGAACKAGICKPSHVLEAMGVPADQGAVRLSLSIFNTEAEVDYLLQVLPGLVQE